MAAIVMRPVDKVGRHACAMDVLSKIGQGVIEVEIDDIRIVYTESPATLHDKVKILSFGIEECEVVDAPARQGLARSRYGKQREASKHADLEVTAIRRFSPYSCQPLERANELASRVSGQNLGVAQGDGTIRFSRLNGSDHLGYRGHGRLRDGSSWRLVRRRCRQLSAGGAVKRGLGSRIQHRGKFRGACVARRRYYCIFTRRRGLPGA